MKATIIFTLLSAVLFASGLFIGAYGGISSAANSNTSEIYAHALEQSALYELIGNGEYQEAKHFICQSLKTKFVILGLAQPVLSSERTDEIDKFKKQITKRIQGVGDSETCV